MKSLSTNLDVVLTAVRASKKLVVSGEGETATIARSTPLGSISNKELKSRTLVAENMPFNPLTIDSIREFFSKFGSVLLVRICTPPNPANSKPTIGATETDEAAASDSAAVTSEPHGFESEPTIVKIVRTYALIEFATEAEAKHALQSLTIDGDWKGPMLVRGLSKSKSKKKTGPAAPGKIGQLFEKGGFHF